MRHHVLIDNPYSASFFSKAHVDGLNNMCDLSDMCSVLSTLMMSQENLNVSYIVQNAHDGDTVFQAMTMHLTKVAHVSVQFNIVPNKEVCVSTFTSIAQHKITKSVQILACGHVHTFSVHNAATACEIGDMVVVMHTAPRKTAMQKTLEFMRSKIVTNKNAVCIAYSQSGLTCPFLDTSPEPKVPNVRS